MAKHRRHHKRHYGGSVAIDLGSYASFDRSIGTKDVLIGLGAGILGAGLARYGVGAWNMKRPTSPLPDVVTKLSPLLGGVVVGLAAWYGRRGKNRAAGFANLVGAAGAGAMITIMPILSDKVSFLRFSDAVGLQIPLQGYPYGSMIVNDGSAESDQGLLNGLLVNDDPQAIRGYADSPSMGRLAAASLDGDEDYSEVSGLAAFAEMRELDVDGQG
jgi:hypothetical protein